MADHPITFQHLQAAALSDLGLVRKNNEDRFFADPENGVFLVADGMGGAEAGEMASEMVKNAVAEVCLEKPPEEAVQTQALIDAVNQASAKIKRFAASAGFTGTGSTVCLLVFDPVNPNRAWTLNAGDSRIYRFHKKSLQQLTTDHTVATAAGVADAKALPAAFRGVLTRAAGLEDRLITGKTTPSLLPVGISSLSGDFEKGDIVAILSESGKHIGFGQARYDARTLATRCGVQNQPVFIHADALVIAERSNI